jgi:hypothetical protein
MSRSDTLLLLFWIFAAGFGMGLLTGFQIRFRSVVKGLADAARFAIRNKELAESLHAEARRNAEIAQRNAEVAAANDAIARDLRAVREYRGSGATES